MSASEIWVLAHLAMTWAMVGVIWTIQLLQYPLMAQVPSGRFVAFEQAHQRRVTAVLALFAPLEMVTAAGVVLAAPAVPRWLSIGAGAVLAAMWISTATFYGPLHGRLSAGFDPVLHRRLVRTNWFRTAGWSLRGGAALAMVAISWP